MIIRTRTCLSMTVLSQRANSGTWKITIRSAQESASSVPLHLPIGRHTDLGPTRDRVDAHLVGVGTEFVRSGEGRLDIFAAGAEVGDERNRVAGFHLAQFELALVEHRELGGVDFSGPCYSLEHV